MSTRVQVITQSMLEDLVAARAAAALAEKKRDQYRKRILFLMDKGSPVEPGELTCCLKSKFFRRLTRRGVIAVLGEEGYDDLVAQVEPHEQTHLIIERGKVRHSPPIRKATQRRDDGLSVACSLVAGKSET